MKYISLWVSTILLLLSGCNLTFAPYENPTSTQPPTRTLPFATDTDATEPATVSNTQPTSATLILVVTDDNTPVNTICVPQSDWYEYTVQPRDNITSIARRTRSTVDELITANCLDNPNQIRRGDIIFVPNEPQN